MLKKMKHPIFLILLTLIIFISVLFLNGKSGQLNATENLELLSTISVEDGASLFGRTCQQCHNSRGIGGKCPTLVRGAWVPEGPNSDQLMFDTIHDGRSGTQMGAFGGMFSDDEIWAIVKYLREESARIKLSDDSQQEEEGFDRR